MALGAPLASLAGDALGWRLVFVAAAGISVLIAVLLGFTIPHIRTSPENKVPIVTALRIPGLLRVAGGWSLLMAGHFAFLTYIDAYLEDLGVPAFVTSIALFVLGAGGIIGIALIARFAQRSLLATLIAAPAVVAGSFLILALNNPALPVVLGAIALWGVGFSATIMVYQQAVLQVGHKAQETATSIGVLLAQMGFAVGATLGGIAVETIGINMLPLIASIFVLVTVVLAATLRSTIHAAQTEAAAGQTESSLPAEH